MKKSWAYVPGFNLSFALLFYLFSNQLVGLFNKGPRGFLPVAEQEVASED